MSITNLSTPFADGSLEELWNNVYLKKRWQWQAKELCRRTGKRWDVQGSRFERDRHGIIIASLVLLNSPDRCTNASLGIVFKIWIPGDAQLAAFKSFKLDVPCVWTLFNFVERFLTAWTGVRRGHRVGSGLEFERVR